VVLTIARPVGPLWLLAYVGLFLFEARPGGVGQAVRSHPWSALAAGAAIASALIANIGWQSQVPPSGVTPAISSALAVVGPALASIPETFGEEIGVFGSQDILMPRWSYAVWGAALILIIGVALLRGKRRDVRTLEIALVGSFGIRWVFGAIFIVTTGGMPQGRHVLPVTVAVAMLAGETVNRNRDAIPQLGRLVTAVGTLLLTIQFVAWYAAAHRFAVGRDGSWWLFSSTDWAPPGGWVPATALVLLGLALIGLSLRWSRPRGSPAIPDRLTRAVALAESG
jgi:hypothetical protein